MYKLCLAALLVFAVPSIATAGGGGAKELGKLWIKNHSKTEVAYCSVDPSPSLQNAGPHDFVKYGGRILNPGESTEYKNMKEGDHMVYCVLKPQGHYPTKHEFNSKKVSTRKGQTVHVKAF
ncbi:hypothetical protein Pla52o_24190 [Novipirellula galeiformis]|uniref:Uncharacterized protein n=1 Tax=Novipirellula galeiformis TaxID=2528004 RepID=A0A5C6CGN6_9BACT|nr:hypothetical protein [Novipirellula galeiformis]TWU22887.1 hypothetical protein Pla52o_24190 [Novipirellula galeiformis]